jgi:hypothetical protein
VDHSAQRVSSDTQRWLERLPREGSEGPNIPHLTWGEWVAEGMKLPNLEDQLLDAFSAETNVLKKSRIAVALGRFGTERSVWPLIEALQRDTILVQIEAAAAEKLQRECENAQLVQQAADLIRRLEQLGASVESLPLLEIREPPDWTFADRALLKLDSYGWVVFTSTNGVHALVSRLKKLGRDLRALGHVRLAAIGPATAATLRAYASTDMNVLKAAQTLGVHPNTVYARLQRIFDISGLQARSYDALTDLLIVCDCHGVDSTANANAPKRSRATDCSS